MTKYAVVVLGLLAANSVAAAWPRDECTDVNFSRECDKENTAALVRHQEKREFEKYVERTKPIQVITPDSSYLAYPSADGKTISVYGRTGRAFDRE